MMKFIQSLFLFFIILFTASVYADVVNVNKADTEMLISAMTGIGEAKARAIIEYREKNGPFKSIDDLVFVKGIGSKTVEKNRDKLSVE